MIKAEIGRQNVVPLIGDPSKVRKIQLPSTSATFAALVWPVLGGIVTSLYY
jgi:hypothetical protein